MLPRKIEELIKDFARLPGIGEKTASRLVLHVLSMPEEISEQLADDLKGIHQKINRCEICKNYTDDKICKICKNEKRSTGQILVVESPLDVIAFEETGFDGRYHITGGLISPLDGIGPDDIFVSDLIKRVQDHTNTTDNVEIIFALPTSLEGEATVEYINSLIDDLPVDVKNIVQTSKLARGLPSNTSVEYQDSNTLSESLHNRLKI
jgi:recombination protein RecR